MNEVQIEDSIMKLQIQMQSFEKALLKHNPELALAYNELLKQDMVMLHTHQKRRAFYAVPGNRNKTFEG